MLRADSIGHGDTSRLYCPLPVNVTPGVFVFCSEFV